MHSVQIEIKTVLFMLHPSPARASLFTRQIIHKMCSAFGVFKPCKRSGVVHALEQSCAAVSIWQDKQPFIRQVSRTEFGVVLLIIAAVKGRAKLFKESA